jgi:hypothetical protein
VSTAAEVTAVIIRSNPGASLAAASVLMILFAWSLGSAAADTVSVISGAVKRMRRGRKR